MTIFAFWFYFFRRRKIIFLVMGDISKEKSSLLNHRASRISFGSILIARSRALPIQMRAIN